MSTVTSTDNTDARRVYLWQCLGKSDARNDIVVLLAEQRAISRAVADRQNGPWLFIECVDRW